MNAGTMMVRVAAGVAAIIVLVLSALVTLGTALAAPFGVFIGNRLALRKQRPFGRLASWISAVTATALAIFLGIGAVLVALPDTAWDEFRDAIAKAEAEQATRGRGGPAWMRPDPATEKIVSSRAFTLTFGIVGGIMGCVLLGAMAGTPGWIATLLLGYAVHGRREPAPAPRPAPPLPEPPEPKPPEPWEPARIPRDPPPPRPPGQ